MHAQPVAAPTLRELIAILMTEVMYGKAHFHITRALQGTHPAIKKTAPQFFDLSVAAHAACSLLHASKLFDKQPKSASIHLLFVIALKHAGTFKNSDPTGVRKAVTSAKQTVSELEPILEAIRTRRHETVAHASCRPFLEPQGYSADSQVSYRQLEGVFEKTEGLLNHFSLLEGGRAIPLELPNTNDVEGILTIVMESLREKARKQEIHRSR